MATRLESSSRHSYGSSASSYHDDLSRALSMSLHDQRQQQQQQYQHNKGRHNHVPRMPQGRHVQQRNHSNNLSPTRARDLERSEQPVLSSPMDVRARSNTADRWASNHSRGTNHTPRRRNSHARRPMLEPVWSSREFQPKVPVSLDDFSGRNSSLDDHYHTNNGGAYGHVMVGQDYHEDGGDEDFSHNSSFSSITGFTYSYPDGSSYYDYQQHNGHPQQLQNYYGMNPYTTAANQEDHGDKKKASNNITSSSSATSSKSGSVDYNSIPGSQACSDDEPSSETEYDGEAADHVDTEEFSVGPGSLYSAYKSSTAARRPVQEWDHSSAGSAFSGGSSVHRQMHKEYQHFRIGAGTNDDESVASELSRGSSPYLARKRNSYQSTLSELTAGSSVYRQHHPEQYSSYRVGDDMKPNPTTQRSSFKSTTSMASEISAGSFIYRHLHQMPKQTKHHPRMERAISIESESSSQDAAPAQPVRKDSVCGHGSGTVFSLCDDRSFAASARHGAIRENPHSQYSGSSSGNGSVNILSLWDDHSFCSTLRRNGEQQRPTASIARSSVSSGAAVSYSSNSGGVTARSGATAATMIEISPGVSAPLRGSEETMDAIRHDLYTPLNCIGCDSSLFCIENAEYVLCPSCKCITPMDMIGSARCQLTAPKRHGLGLGFTVEDLFRMQSEIMQSNSS